MNKIYYPPFILKHLLLLILKPLKKKRKEKIVTGNQIQISPLKVAEAEKGDARGPFAMTVWLVRID